MSTAPALEERTPAAKLPYGRRQEIAYRSGVVLQMLGAAILALLYPLRNPFYTAGIMLFEAGVLLSAVYLLVSRRTLKKLILGCVLIGMVMQVAGAFLVREEYAGSVIIAGIGLVSAGASGIAANEACCFGYREGWVLALSLPFMVLANFFGRENIIFNSFGFSVLFLLLLSLTGTKLRQTAAK